MPRSNLKNPFKLNKRIKHFIFKHASDSMYEIYSNIMIKWDVFCYREYDRQYDAETSFMVCPSSLECGDDGESLYINKRPAQMFAIAGLPHTDPTEVGIRKYADPSAVDKIFEVANQNSIDTTFTQILYKMSSEQTNSETNKELINLDWIRRLELKTKGIASRWLHHQEEDIENFSKQSFDGLHSQLKQLILVRVDGDDMDEVRHSSAHMQLHLRGHGFNTEIPYGAQMKALEASVMSNELMSDWCTKVMSNTAAAMWPGRTPLKHLDESGILLGYLNQGKDSGIPLYLDLERDIYDNKHFAVFGGSGHGKTTLFLYLLWNAIAAGYNFMHIVPKQDHGTSHLEMIKALGGQLAYVGTPEYSPNPYAIIWDPTTHGDTEKDMKLAFNAFRATIKNFWHMIIGTSFSPAMQAVFKKSLTALYREKGYINEKSWPINRDKWLDFSKMPAVEDHIQIWEDWLKSNDPEHVKERSSLRALLNYAFDFRDGEALSWLNNHNDFNPRARFLTIDITNVPDEYQDAITVLIISIISARLKTPNPDAYKSKPRTIITIDEGPRVLSQPGMEKFAPTLFREARSGKCSIIVNGQDKEGMKKILPVVKSNTDATIFMCGMQPAEIEEFKEDFLFEPLDMEILAQQGKGKFLFYKQGRKIPGIVIPSKIQRRVFFNEKTSEHEAEENFSGEDYELIPGVEKFVEEFGVLPYNWIAKLENPEIPGMTRVSKVYPVSDSLSKVNFVSNDILADIEAKGTHCGESLDHWITKVQMAGEAYQAGWRDLIINTWGDQGGEEDPDVTGITPSGKRGGLEYAHPGSRNIGRLRDQRNKHLKYCDVWMCVCQSSNEQAVSVAVGDKYYRTRGSEFRKWLDSTRVNEPEVNIKEEIRKANKEDEERSNENSSSPLNINETGTNSNLEDGEVLGADGTILQEVA